MGHFTVIFKTVSYCYPNTVLNNILFTVSPYVLLTDIHVLSSSLLLPPDLSSSVNNLFFPSCQSINPNLHSSPLYFYSSQSTLTFLIASPSLPALLPPSRSLHHIHTPQRYLTTLGHHHHHSSSCSLTTSL